MVLSWLQDKKGTRVGAFSLEPKMEFSYPLAVYAAVFQVGVYRVLARFKDELSNKTHRYVLRESSCLEDLSRKVKSKLV